MRIIVSSAYVALKRNHPNSGWSERLAIRQQHVGDVPRYVLAQRDVGQLHVIADRGRLARYAEPTGRLSLTQPTNVARQPNT